MAFTHILFDLDETLYPRGVGLLQEINQRIDLWLQKAYDLSPAEADALRRRFFLLYGTTLGGLVAERNVDVEAYLAFVHDVSPEQYLEPYPALAAMLRSIPLYRVVFTNGPADHAHRVLQALGVADAFECVVGIQEIGLASKPTPAAYERLLTLLGAAGPACIMVEDRAANLHPAKRLGMTTVLVDATAENGVDYEVSDVLAVGPLVARLLCRLQTDDNGGNNCGRG